MIQFFQQPLRLLQVFRVKSFGEPVVDLRQQLSGFCSPALLLPQASEARGGTEFERLRTQFAGRVNCLLKTGLGFVLGLGARGRGSATLDFGPGTLDCL